MSTTYFVVSWVAHDRRHRAPKPTTREYGTASSKQAAIRLAERVLPADAEYLVTTLHTTVHHSHTPHPRNEDAAEPDSRHSPKAYADRETTAASYRYEAATASRTEVPRSARLHRMPVGSAGGAQREPPTPSTPSTRQFAASAASSLVTLRAYDRVAENGDSGPRWVQ